MTRFIVFVSHSLIFLTYGLWACGITACGGPADQIQPQLGNDHSQSQQSCDIRFTDFGVERTLVQGAPLRTSNGILFNEEDRLFVASVVGRRITEIHPRSGRILNEYGPEVGVDTPDDLSFGPDGSMYWTSFFTGEIGRLRPDGSKQTIAMLGTGVNAMTFSDDGRLFVTRVFLGDELYELDPEGVAPPRVVASGLGGFNGMDFGPDGLLYGPQWFLGQIGKIDVDTGEVTTVATGFDTPAAVKFNSQGELFVVDQHLGEVLRVDIESGLSEVIAHTEVGVDNLTFNSRDQLYLSNAHDGSVVRVKRNGRTKVVSRGGLTAPGGLALAGGEQSLFAADAYTLRQFHSTTGAEQSVVHSIVGDFSGLVTPLTVAPHGDNLVVTSWFGKTVQVWDHAAQAVLGMYLVPNLPLNAIGFAQDTVVAELLSGCVTRYRTDPTGENIACGFYVPTGLAQRDGNLWVADWATGVVWQIAADGDYLATPAPVATGLVQPEGIAVTSDNHLLVYETGLRQIVRIDLATGTKTTIVEDLETAIAAPPGAPPAWIFNAVAVDDCGVIYISQDSTGSILKVRPWSSFFCQ